MLKKMEEERYHNLNLKPYNIRYCSVDDTGKIVGFFIAQYDKERHHLSNVETVFFEKETNSFEGRGKFDYDHGREYWKSKDLFNFYEILSKNNIETIEFYIPNSDFYAKKIAFKVCVKYGYHLVMKKENTYFFEKVEEEVK